MNWLKDSYNKQYESWVPWAEDKYLAYFGENKSSYVAKGTYIYPRNTSPNADAPLILLIT